MSSLYWHWEKRKTNLLIHTAWHLGWPEWPNILEIWHTRCIPDHQENADTTDGIQQQVSSPATLYLLDDYTKVSIEQFKNLFFLFHIQNLEWSELFFEQSSEDELKKNVLQKVMKVPDVVSVLQSTFWLRIKDMRFCVFLNYRTLKW